MNASGADQVKQGIKKISVIGVLVGGIVDVASTVILSLPMLVYITARVNLVHVPPDRLQAVMAAALHGNITLSLLQWLSGVAGSILGGYVAAWIAKHDELLNGTLSAYLCVLLGFQVMLVGKLTMPLAEHLLAIVAGVACALLGGYLRLAQNRATLRAQVAPQALR